MVFGQAPVAAEPGKCALYHPALGEDDKPFNPDRPQYRLQQPAAGLFHPGDQLPSISSVSPDDLQARQLGCRLLQQRFGAIAILNICRMHEDGQNQSQGVHQQMAFASRDFFSPRRTRVRRLGLWSSPTDYLGRPHSAGPRGHRVGEASVAKHHERTAKCHLGTNAGSSRTPIPKEENREASCARHSRHITHRGRR
jgi:hypothetical protein